MRLRMKVWTKPGTNVLYMVAGGYLDKLFNTMVAYAMRDEETIQIRLSVDEYNALPYHFFKEDGPAPKPDQTWIPDPVGGRIILP